MAKCKDNYIVCFDKYESDLSQTKQIRSVSNGFMAYKRLLYRISMHSYEFIASLCTKPYQDKFMIVKLCTNSMFVHYYDLSNKPIQT